MNYTREVMMEKLFAALIPVVCVMALGPLWCQATGKVVNRKASRQVVDTRNASADRESLCA
jgi:hypothetical protein